MSNDKPNFKANSSEPADTPKVEKPKKPARKEQVVVWEKQTNAGEPYLSIKVRLPDGSDLWTNAFKNNFKKAGETAKPSYIAYEKGE